MRHVYLQVKFASGEEGQSLVSDLASICCLLVWIPALPKERIIRVLFPGNTSEVGTLKVVSIQTPNSSC